MLFTPLIIIAISISKKIVVRATNTITIVCADEYDVPAVGRMPPTAIFSVWVR
jgi:hypothetical protein